MADEKEKLFNKNYIFCCISNFLLNFSFFIVIPILALYLKETYETSGAKVGLILSVYVVSAMLIRPFSAYIIDSFPRKPFFVGSLALFALVFLSYNFASSIGMFVILRALHGLSFGATTIGSNTIVIDVIPSKYRGEGLGYFGLSNNFAMALGPIVGVTLHDSLPEATRYVTIFSVAFALSIIGVLAATQIQTKYRPPVERPALSLDRFFLIKGIPAGINLLMTSITYAVTMNYIYIYAKENSINITPGAFYTCMAIGIATSRIFSGKKVDRGFLNRVIIIGIAIATLAFFLLSTLPYLNFGDKSVIFILSALILGCGYGTIFPAYNTLFVALGRNDQRGSATSTYLTSWEVGAGIGIFCGGAITEYMQISSFYIIGTILNLSAIVLFATYTSKHFNRWNIGYKPCKK